jgi:hypothetical protein
MATVNGLTAEKTLELADANIVGAAVVGNNLILTTRGGATINAGNVRGIQGIQGPEGSVTSAQLTAALAPINAAINTTNLNLTNSRVTVLQLIEKTVDQTLVYASESGEDLWQTVSGMSWVNTFTPGRYLEVSFGLNILTYDNDGAYFEARLLRNGGSPVLRGNTKTFDNDIVGTIDSTRKLLVPNTWVGPQTFQLQLKHTSFTYNTTVIIKNAAHPGYLSFVDMGVPS